MTDRTALLAAICAAPDDDAPRLVYADWLDEHGESERAELIRAQVELAQCLLCADPNERDRCHACPELTERARDLLADYWRDWVPDVPKVVRVLDNVLYSDAVIPNDGFRMHFARGFIGRITCTAADWLQHGDALSWSPEMTDLCPACFGHYHSPSCPRCNKSGVATGRVPRPCPATAQPVRTVRLTTWPEFEQAISTANLLANRRQLLVVRPDGSPLQYGEGDSISEAVTAALRREWPAVETWVLPPERLWGEWTTDEVNAADFGVRLPANSGEHA